MKRVVTVLAVVALMAAMMVVAAVPALAQDINCINSTQTNGQVLPIATGLQILQGNACGNGVNIEL